MEKLRRWIQLKIQDLIAWSQNNKSGKDEEDEEAGNALGKKDGKGWKGGGVAWSETTTTRGWNRAERTEGGSREIKIEEKEGGHTVGFKSRTRRTGLPIREMRLIFFPVLLPFSLFFFLSFPFLFLSFSLCLCLSSLSTIQGVSKTGGINRKRVILRIKNNKERKNNKLRSWFCFWINQVWILERLFYM